jgi:hypothetical protein
MHCGERLTWPGERGFGRRRRPLAPVFADGLKEALIDFVLGATRPLVREVQSCSDEAFSVAWIDRTAECSIESEWADFCKHIFDFF